MSLAFQTAGVNKNNSWDVLSYKRVVGRISIYLIPFLTFGSHQNGNVLCKYFVYCCGTIALLLVGQLLSYYRAVSVKSARFGRECKQSISNIFLIFHLLWHFQDGNN